MLSFNINNDRVKELRELAQATARKHQAVLSMSREELDYIQRNVQISAIGASTRIENAALTDAEVDWLDTTLAQDARTTAYPDHREFIQDKLSRDKERSIDEVAGCRAMLHRIATQAGDFFPLSETILRALHNELLQYYDSSSHYCCFNERPEIRLQRRMIIEDTVLPRTTVTDALRILKERGFIQRLGRGAGIRYQLIF